MFEVPDAYEAMMGRWSRQLAPLFIDFVGVRDADKVLDVGCGTGSLTTTLARVSGASKLNSFKPRYFASEMPWLTKYDTPDMKSIRKRIAKIQTISLA